MQRFERMRLRNEGFWVIVSARALIILLDRKSTRLNSSHTVIFSLSLHDALPIWDFSKCHRVRQRGGTYRRQRGCSRVAFLSLRSASTRRNRLPVQCNALSE